MLKIGCHLSISKGYYKAALEALSIEASTFQFFPRNPLLRNLPFNLETLNDIEGYKEELQFLRSEYK